MTGQGQDIKLTKSQFEDALDLVGLGRGQYGPPNILTEDGRIIKTSWGGYKASFSWYDTKYENVFGGATIIFDQHLNPVGLYDKWDFDWKPWGERSVKGEIKTRAGGWKLKGGTPFEVKYGKQ